MTPDAVERLASRYLSPDLLERAREVDAELELDGMFMPATISYVIAEAVAARMAAAVEAGLVPARNPARAHTVEAEP